MTSLLTLDRTVTAFLFALVPHTPLGNALFGFLSGAGITVVVWGVILLAFSLVEERYDRHFILFFGLTCVAAWLIGNEGLKYLFARPRPDAGLFPAWFTPTLCPADFSFPSGHATLSFTAASLLSSFDRKRRPFFYAVAVLVAYSRIYLGCHFFLDVLGGGALGCLIGQIGGKIHSSYSEKKTAVHKK